MHIEILSNKQQELLPWVQQFKREFYLVGGTAITIEQISTRATEIFGELFSEKMFRAQLCYFEDVDYFEEVDWLIPKPPTDNEIRAALIELSTASL